MEWPNKRRGKTGNANIVKHRGNSEGTRNERPLGASTSYLHTLNCNTLTIMHQVECKHSRMRSLLQSMGIVRKGRLRSEVIIHSAFSQTSYYLLNEKEVVAATLLLWSHWKCNYFVLFEAIRNLIRFLNVHTKATARVQILLIAPQLDVDKYKEQREEQCRI